MGIFFLVIHAVGNLHVFLGPDDFNGYGYFYVRLYWSGFGLPANIVEEYVLLSALLHATVAILRTRTIWKNRNRYDGKVNSGTELSRYTGHLISSFMKNLLDGTLSLILTGLLLGLFMTIHLFQFRFGATQDYYIRVPPWMGNWFGIFSLNLFWDYDKSLPLMGVRDIYQLEFDLFRSTGWVAFYIFSVCVFMVHACLVWIYHFLGSRIDLHIISCILYTPSHNGHWQRTWDEIGTKTMCCLERETSQLHCGESRTT